MQPASQPGGHWLDVLLGRLYYHRIRVLHPERLPAAGPVLYLGLHRNGAVDGFVYGSHLPSAVFMISAQLRRNAVGRLFFRGIEVARGKDAERGISVDNLAAVTACVRHITEGGALFVLPEGTSDLGHRHLPFQKGAARIFFQSLAAGARSAVVPLSPTTRPDRGRSSQAPVAPRPDESVDGLPAPWAPPPAETATHRVPWHHRCTGCRTSAAYRRPRLPGIPSAPCLRRPPARPH
ncbi:MAG: hypothetical protein HGA75_13380 [Thiobacillus sp.]|nr:hypothetical protein [Thiobacillus sp.]